MARPQMVTRTFTTTKAKLLAVRVSNERTEFVDITLPRTYKDAAEILKFLGKHNTDPDLKYVHVVSKEEVETLYGMDEADFIAHAKILPPRVKNENAEDSDNADNQ